jgi:hypothetical protein
VVVFETDVEGDGVLLVLDQLLLGLLVSVPKVRAEAEECVERRVQGAFEDHLLAALLFGHTRVERQAQQLPLRVSFVICCCC